MINEIMTERNKKKLKKKKKYVHFPKIKHCTVFHKFLLFTGLWGECKFFKAKFKNNFIEFLLKILHIATS